MKAKNNMEAFSFEKASKFKDKDKFFDINYVLVPGLSWTVEKFYYTSIKPETVVILSLISGIIAAFLYASDNYQLNLIAILFIQLKNYLDTVDGHIARAKDIASRFGRFLDSLADAFVYICLFTAIGFNLAKSTGITGSFVLSYTAMICAFLQCSVYNYYLVSYKTHLMGKGLNRTNEDISEEDKELHKNGLEGIALYSLQIIYQFVYAWQDRIIECIDSFMLKRFQLINHNLGLKKINEEWYADKRFLAFVSPLCFGTQILILSFFTIANNLTGFLWFIIIIGNIYTAIIIVTKTLAIKGVEDGDTEELR